MLSKFRNRRAQSTAEYAILIGVVVAALVAMQTYVKRGLNGRMKAATDSFAAQTPELGATTQYEPYYLQQDTNTATNSTSNENIATGGAITRGSDSTTVRAGNQTTGW